MRQVIILALMFLALVLSPTPTAPKPKPAPIKADKAVAHKPSKAEPFTTPLPVPVRVITESYLPFPSEPVFTLPVEAMRVHQASQTPSSTAEQQKKLVVAAATPKPAKRADDICRGKGRSYYNNGRSWRCNR